MAERITGHTGLIGLMAYPILHPALLQCRMRLLQNSGMTTLTLLSRLAQVKEILHISYDYEYPGYS